jgi:hypothetical protein
VILVGVVIIADVGINGMAGIEICGGIRILEEAGEY